MRVRHLRDHENWPDTLNMGFNGDCLDREWCWVAEENGVVIAGLLATPLHGLVFLLRLVTVAKAPTTATLALFRIVLKETQERGCKGYVTLLDPATEDGQKLDSLVTRLNGIRLPSSLVMSCGDFSAVGVL